MSILEIFHVNVILIKKDYLNIIDFNVMKNKIYLSGNSEFFHYICKFYTFHINQVD